MPAFLLHDVRHRRISLLHLSDVPWARLGEHVGQWNVAVIANTYSHVLAFALVGAWDGRAPPTGAESRPDHRVG